MSSSPIIHSTSNTVSHSAPFPIATLATSSTFSTPPSTLTSSTSAITQAVASTDRPSEQQPSSTSNGGLADSGALYLYTFLATLVLLLSISCAIVIRSLVLRRRRSRIIAEAINNGTWFPRTPTSFHDFGAKPPLHEAFVGDVKGSTIGKGGLEELDWDVIMPFSATYVTPHTEHTNPDATALPPATPSRMGRLVTFFRRPNQPNSIIPLSVSSPTITSALALTPASPLTSSPPTPPLTTKSLSTSSTLRLAVLIAMPAPPRAQHVHRSGDGDEDEDEQMPHVEFGVADVEVGQGVNNGGS